MNYILPLTFLMLIYHVVLGSEEVNNDEFTDGDTGVDSLHRVRRGLSMLRLGRGLQMLRLGKRALPMLRLGRSAADGLSGDEVQYLLSLMRSQRQVPLPRYGKDLSKDLQYILMNALMNAEQQSELYNDENDNRMMGFGYDLEGSPERQIRPIPRPGRYRRSADLPAAETDSELAQSDYAKRIPTLPRYGKELSGEEDYDITDAEKRAMRMLRLGRGMRMLRLGKRPEDDEEAETDVEKRALRLLRLGKRPYNMLRLGRGYSSNDDEKRALRLLRLGKRSDDDLSS